MFVTKDMRTKKARTDLENAHQSECNRIKEVYEELCEPVNEYNQQTLTNWKAAKAAIDEEYGRLCREVDEQRRRQLAVWEAVNAERDSEHQQLCREVDEANRRLIADWENVNATWIEEEKRWGQRAKVAEGELRRSETELFTRRSAGLGQFEKRKKEAEEIVSSYNNAKKEYDKEFKKSEVNSTKIQLEEYLDKALIRNAKLSGITNERVFALETFGVETAKDVLILNTLKVPGIGPILTNRLIAWRANLLQMFVPKKSLPESEKNRLAGRFAPVLLPLGQSLQAAIRDLESIIQANRRCEHELFEAIGSAVQIIAIIEAHLDKLNHLQ